MNGYTFTYRSNRRLRFAAINADSEDSARRQLLERAPDADIISVRVQDDPHEFIGEVTR